MNDIKVSVILPVFNAEKTLKTAIDSILEQTYKNFELIIINDGSNDLSEAIIKAVSYTHLTLPTNREV